MARSAFFARRSDPGRRLARILIYFLLVLWSLVCVFPLYWIALTSITTESELISGPHYLPFVDFWPSLNGWINVLTKPSDHIILRYFNSVLVASASTLITLLLGGMAVYGLTRFRILPSARLRWLRPIVDNRAIFVAILATRILPPMVVVLPIYIVAQYTGTLDTRLSLIFTYTAANLPVAVWLLLPILGGSASEQEEAARLEGASNFRVFWEIAVPMARAGTIAVGLLVFILCWNEYLFAAFLTGDHAMTLPPWLVGQVSTKEAQVGEDAVQWPNLSAAAILMLIPVVAGAILVQRFIGRLAVGARLG